MNVTVWVARTATPPPTTLPVSLSRPLGTSSASTCPRCRARAVSRAARSAKTPSSARASPIPNMPSTSQPQASNDAGGASTIFTPASRATPSAQRASSGFTSTGMQTSTAIPARLSCAATTSASPPLLPGPATIHTGCAPSGAGAWAICSSRKWAAAAPARAISVCAGTADCAAVSLTRSCATVRSGTARSCGLTSVAVEAAEEAAEEAAGVASVMVASVAGGSGGACGEGIDTATIPEPSDLGVRACVRRVEDQAGGKSDAP
ncbi:hypothetical protein PT2222_310055 [Paraburkholderia tropica]